LTADHYGNGTYQWWHLSTASPELVAALADGWLTGTGRVLDLGCGLGTEAGYLASIGWLAVGIDLSMVALARAAGLHADTRFLCADLRWLPFRRGFFDAALDRGCFHYLQPGDRPRYAAEARRVLRPGGKLLLRASLRAAGVRNDIDEAVISDAFTGWQIAGMERAAVPSDTRQLEVLVVRLQAI
jgi:SAM-dependent methyltransferase